MPLIIKPMETNAEIDGKAYVHYRSWQETYAGLIDQAYLDQRTLEQYVKNAHRWTEGVQVAQIGEKVVGFVACGPSQEEDAGEIFGLYVLAEYHGQKIGYELLKAAAKSLKTYPKIKLWVLEGNERAIHFYERFGFRFTGKSAEIELGTPRNELQMVFVF